MTPRVDPSRTEGPNRAGLGRAVLALAVLALACAGLVLLGSLAHGTTRTWEPTPPGASNGTLMEEGAGRWAAWTFLCGLAALGLVLLATRAGDGGHRALAAIPASLAIPPFALAALLAGRHWLRLLEERDRERDYALSIASGLPIVTLAASVGAVLSLLIAAALLTLPRRALHRPRRPS